MADQCSTRVDLGDTSGNWEPKINVLLMHASRQKQKRANLTDFMYPSHPHTLQTLYLAKLELTVHLRRNQSFPKQMSPVASTRCSRKNDHL